MSYQLPFGSNETILIRDKGTANSVLNFVNSENTVGKNVTALPTVFLFQLLNYIQFPLGVSSIVWLKVSGVWKQGIVWIKQGGVWKQGTTYIKESGQWK